MDLNSITLFSSVKQKMNWLTERQKVLAQNVANADTPGYVPKDLKKISFKAQLDQTTVTGGLHLQTTQPGHMTGVGPGRSQHEIKVEDANFSIQSQNGNAVNIEDELTKMSETQMEYATAINLYRKHVTMLKTALGKR